MNSNVRVHVPALVWGGLVFIASVIPGNDLPEVDFRLADKLVHVALYLVLTVFAFRSFSVLVKISPLKVNLLLLILCSLYGIVLEQIQRFVPGRTSSLDDAVANVIGVLLGILLINTTKKAGIWQK